MNDGILDTLTQDCFVFAGTGSRDLALDTNRELMFMMFEWVCETITAAKVKHPNLFGISGGAEGWDQVIAFACIATGTDYGLVIPTADYGEYYYTPADPANKKKRGSVNGDDRRHVYKQMSDRAVHVEVNPGKLMQHPTQGWWGYQNDLRNQRMVDLADIMWIFDMGSRGTRDCMKRIKADKRRFYVFNPQGRLL